jgi:hypothetical protein
MPAQDRGRCHQALVGQRFRQLPNQRGQDHPVGPVQARSWIPAPQYRDPVTQHEQLGVPCRVGARQEHQPGDEPSEDQVEQPQRHEPRSSQTQRPAAGAGRSHEPTSGTPQALPPSLVTTRSRSMRRWTMPRPCNRTRSRHSAAVWSAVSSVPSSRRSPARAPDEGAWGAPPKPPGSGAGVASKVLPNYRSTI